MLNSYISIDYKQQIDHLTQAIIQSKNLSSNMVKETKELKTQMVVLKKELFELKDMWFNS